MLKIPGRGDNGHYRQPEQTMNISRIKLLSTESLRVKQDCESFNTPFHGKSAKEIIEHFSACKFVDDHGHRLEMCEDCHTLTKMAMKADSASQ